MKKEILISLAALIILSGSIVYSNFDSPKKFVSQATSTASVTPNAQAETLNDSSLTSPKYKITINYPEIEGLKNSHEQFTINSMIQEIIQKHASDFKTSVEEQKDSSSENFVNDLTISYSLAQVSDSIVSTQFEISNFEVGEANPDTYVETFNYDVKGKRVLALKDIFTKDANYVEVLADTTRKKLEVQLQEIPHVSEMIEEGTSPIEDNFKLFTLTKDSLLIIFNPAQVGPRVAGTQTVKISFSEIRDILNPELSLI